MMDILFFGAHPDDVELACSGTILKYIASGKEIGIVDLTRGELGTRGTAEIRTQESTAARKVLGVSVSENLELSDGFVDSSKESQMAVVNAIRKHRPEIVIAPATSDRHPDHGNAAKLISEACFKSGLIKLETKYESWRPKVVYHYPQDRFINPDFVVDITGFMDQKMEVVKCYESQFFQENSEEPETPISVKGFLDFIKSRASHFGRPVNAKYGEGYTVERPIGIDDLTILK
ncbi:MAG: bacillithiol biosynthesis deacetylase BshB1 [Flavobacteriales bacterium]|nr:bacillithiol biosynthesis deacetylase BshB1 [Flavobacteriales bacterium]